MFKPRPAQEEIINYRKGRMGVSAVPGSGKTHTLSYLATNLIANDFVKDDQEVLIVTLVNSAVDNFAQKIAVFMQEFGLLPHFGYRIRTLHGLAHDIVREKPELVGLENRFQIADERATNDILNEVVRNWISTHSDLLIQYTKPEKDLKNSYIKKQWHELLVNLGNAFIRQAKDLQAMPINIRALLDKYHSGLPLLEMGYEIYRDYQNALHIRAAVDFEDLTRLAYKILKMDKEYLERLRKRWPWILEDEAQDSSELQEKILRLLVGKDGNWVRVGDPNQAIFETFTTADPKFLRDFLKEKGVLAKNLPNSGRSTRSIISLANQLIKWTSEHSVPELQSALTTPFIEMVPSGDPQPNPTNNPEAIHLVLKKYKPDAEIRTVSTSIKNWLQEHPEDTVAVLVPRNYRGAEIADALKTKNVETIELLKSSTATRQSAMKLAKILQFFADPINKANLSNLFKALYQDKYNEPEDKLSFKHLCSNLKKVVQIENILFPYSEEDWMRNFNPENYPKTIYKELANLRELIFKWQRASLLPIDQFILIISQDIFQEPSDLALSHKLASVLDMAKKIHPDWSLNEFARELDAVAHNRTKLYGFSDQDLRFDPDRYKGKVVVATIHKAKGLEWDRVYILSVNNYNFPSAQSYDHYISEKWFVKGELNLGAEMISQLKALLLGNKEKLFQKEGITTNNARLDYCAERLRMLYVGITRARKELVITWNDGRHSYCQAALPFVALQTFWEKNNAPTT
ncbi:MAG TPA: ATP-dependent helicase [Anaerolineae bacterium]|nr:ATP-dependent helicase [Anaerolineae bacterium]